MRQGLMFEQDENEEDDKIASQVGVGLDQVMMSSSMYRTAIKRWQILVGTGTLTRDRQYE